MIVPSATLFRYINRRFMLHMLAVMGILLFVLAAFEIIETLRRAGGRVDLPEGAALTLPLLKLPYLGERILPMGVLFAAMYTFWRLNKTSELAVIRAAGLSAWQFLTPVVLAAGLTGVLSTAVLNPFSSVLLAKHDRLERAYFEGSGNLASVSKTGIWLRQPMEGGYALLHAETLDRARWQLNAVLILFFDSADNFLRRLDAPIADLKDGSWAIPQATVNGRSGPAAEETDLRLATALTPEKIEDSFSDPETTPFWTIPDYIKIMEETGIPATRLYIHFHGLLAQPLLFAAMVLLAASFSLRPTRLGAVATLVAGGIAAGLLVFFLQSFLGAFGIAQKIPPFLAAWSPSLIALLLGGTALLHLEDG